MSKKTSNAEDVKFDDGGLLPGETAPETKGGPIEFERLPDTIDRFQLSFFDLKEDGATIDCQFIRLIAPGQLDNLEHAAIEVREYPSGDPYLLPGSMQLWEIFTNLDAEKCDFDKAVFRITKTQTVLDAKGNTKFNRYRVQRGWRS